MKTNRITTFLIAILCVICVFFTACDFNIGNLTVNEESGTEQQQPQNPPDEGNGDENGSGNENIFSDLHRETNYSLIESEKATDDDIKEMICELNKIFLLYNFEINVTAELMNWKYGQGTIVKRDGKKISITEITNYNNYELIGCKVISENSDGWVYNKYKDTTYDSGDLFFGAIKYGFTDESFMNSWNYNFKPKLETTTFTYDEELKRYLFVIDEESAYLIIKGGRIIYAGGIVADICLYDFGTTKIDTDDIR